MCIDLSVLSRRIVQNMWIAEKSSITIVPHVIPLQGVEDKIQMGDMFEQYSYRWFFHSIDFFAYSFQNFLWILNRKRFILARYAFGISLFLLHIFLFNLISLEVRFLSRGTLPSILRHNVYAQESHIHVDDKAICMRSFCCVQWIQDIWYRRTEGKKSLWRRVLSFSDNFLYPLLLTLYWCLHIKGQGVVYGTLVGTNVGLLITGWCVLYTCEALHP